MVSGRRANVGQGVERRAEAGSTEIPPGCEAPSPPPSPWLCQGEALAREPAQTARLQRVQLCVLVTSLPWSQTQHPVVSLCPHRPASWAAVLSPQLSQFPFRVSPWSPPHPGLSPECLSRGEPGSSYWGRGGRREKKGVSRVSASSLPPPPCFPCL